MPSHLPSPTARRKRRCQAPFIGRLVPFAACVLAWALALSACVPSRAARVEEAMAKGAGFLRSLQGPSGEICDTLNPLFDLWETVEAAHALQSAAPATSAMALQKAMDFLKQHENASGLLCHNRACRAATCVETSAEYLILLSKQPGQVPASGKQLDALALLRQADGSWLIGNPDVQFAKGFPSVSGFALSAYQSGTTAPSGLQPALDETRAWLLAQQLPDGSWGSTWEYYGCPGYALWAILPAIHSAVMAGENSAITSEESAKGFIRSSQKPDGSWHHSLPPATQQHGPASTKICSPALQTALMLAAYLATAPAPDDPCLLSGIDFLLTCQQTNGAWDGGFFPIPHRRYEKREYVFATAIALRALAQFKSISRTAP